MKKSINKVCIVSLESAGTMGHMTLTTKLADLLAKNEIQVTVFSQYNYKDYANLKTNLVRYIKIKKQESKYTVSGCLDYDHKNNLLKKIMNINPKIIIFSTFFDPEMVVIARRNRIKTILISYPLRDSHREAFMLRNHDKLFDKVLTLSDLYSTRISYPNEQVVRPIKTISSKTAKPIKAINNILVTCGGAARPSADLFFTKIKKIVPQILKQHKDINFTIIKARFKERLKLPKTKLLKWSKRFSDLLSSSELVISEAGYFTVMDLISLKKPAILIPGERRIDNQELRALEFEAKGGGLTFFPVQESGILKQMISDLINNPARLNKMRTNLSQLNKRIFLKNITIDKAVLKELQIA